MNKKQNIFLIGPMGAGKTTIGRQLARALQRDFFDTDQAVEQRTGVDIAWIFDVEGEEGFREREQAILDELTQMSGIVLATGGGIIMSRENRRYISSRGIVLYLQISLEEQLLRTEKDKRRPLLQTDDKRTKLEALIRQREMLYAEIADHTIDTTHRSIKVIIDNILQQIS